MEIIVILLFGFFGLSVLAWALPFLIWILPLAILGGLFKDDKQD